MAKIKRNTVSDEFQKLRLSSIESREKNDCSVIAASLVCGVTYQMAHSALNLAGRKDRDGASFICIRRAIDALGFKLVETDQQAIIKQYPGQHKGLKNITSYHPSRFNSVWKDGKKYLMKTTGHVLAVIDGVTHDWSSSRALRCTMLFEVVAK